MALLNIAQEIYSTTQAPAEGLENILNYLPPKPELPKSKPYPERYVQNKKQDSSNYPMIFKIVVDIFKSQFHLCFYNYLILLNFDNIPIFVPVNFPFW